MVGSVTTLPLPPGAWGLGQAALVQVQCLALPEKGEKR